MSPASQGGGLEVKRYIGSCLISGTARGPPPPLLPLPLVPVGVAGGGGGAFSRLAAHTQGAPLILAGRYGPRKPAQGQRAPRRQQHQSETETRPARGGGGAPAPPPRQPAAEAPSTASDESSGPADNCLPRIIKPRKRRKKDRKPTAPEASSIVTLKPYVPLCYDGGGRRRAERPLSPEAAPFPEADGGESRCQCGLCDPAHIWDATPPEPLDTSPFASIPLFLSAPAGGGDADTDDGFFSDELPTAPSSALRRSWSSSSDTSSGSALSLEVFTEIVTSPNGHRDIEIKFYSSSPPSGGAAVDSEDVRRNVCEEQAWSESARADVWDSEDDVERYLGESLWANIEEPDSNH